MTFSPTITVASASDADIARATQEIAAALESTVAAAPQQWYSFKPMWPPTEEEAAELAARGARMLAGKVEARVATPAADPIDLLAPTIDDGPGAGDPDTIKAVEGAPS